MVNIQLIFYIKYQYSHLSCQFVSKEHFLFTFLYYQLRRIMESLKSYDILKTLGKGSFATVFLVLRLSDRKQYAMKQINFKDTSLKDKQNALNEIRLLASLNDEHIIGFRSSFFDCETEQLCIVMQYAESGDLSEKISLSKKNKSFVQQNEVWKLIYHLAKALKYLHGLNIIHRDLKTANVFQSNGTYKLADFNISKIVPSQNPLAQTQTGTPFYASPEIWDNTKYDFKSDIWSLGIISYEFACLKLPFPAEDFNQLYLKIQKGKYDRIPTIYSNELFSMIRDMMNPDPKLRPTAEQIINSCEFNNIRVKKNRPRRNSETNSLLDTIMLPRDMYTINMIMPKPKYSENKQNEIDPDEVFDRDRLNTQLQQHKTPSKFRERIYSIRENNQPSKQQLMALKQPDVNLLASKMTKSKLTESGTKTQRMLNIQGKLRPSKLPSVPKK